MGTGQSVGISLTVGASSLQAYQIKKIRNFITYIFFVVQTRFVSVMFKLNVFNACMYLHSIQVNCIELAIPIVKELKKLEESGVAIYDASLQ